jgi:hypothetical protein
MMQGKMVKLDKNAIEEYKKIGSPTSFAESIRLPNMTTPPSREEIIFSG